MNEIIFSIITPNYNSGNKLLRCIQSNLSNNVQFEHIIVDDCSTDSSFSIAKSNVTFQNLTTSNIIFLRNESNKGPGYSRNRGLKLAKGKYIVFLDSDDYFIDGALDIIYSHLKKKDIDVMVFNYNVITNQFKNSKNNSNSNTLHRLNDPLRLFLKDKIISAPWGKCIKSNIAKAYKFPDLRVSQDAPYNLDIFTSSNNVYKLEYKLYNFDKTSNTSITRQNFTMEELLRFYNSWEYFERKASSSIAIDDIAELISARKILFCATYYMNRLIIDKNQPYDKRIINFIKKIIQENISSSWHVLNPKVKALSISFLIAPEPTLYAYKKFLHLRAKL